MSRAKGTEQAQKKSPRFVCGEGWVHLDYTHASKARYKASSDGEVLGRRGNPVEGSNLRAFSQRGGGRGEPIVLFLLLLSYLTIGFRVLDGIKNREKETVAFRDRLDQNIQCCRFSRLTRPAERLGAD